MPFRRALILGAALTIFCSSVGTAGPVERIHCWFAKLPRPIQQLPRQLVGGNPFGGDLQPTRIPWFALGRPSLPFPHPWNYQRPLDILATYFHGADNETGPGRHNRYFEVPGLDPVLVTRDPEVIRAILLGTGDKTGQFDRDQMPSQQINNSTSKQGAKYNSMLFDNGKQWRDQRKAAAAPFGLTALFQPEVFHGFEGTFLAAMEQRIDELKRRLAASGQTSMEVKLEPEIKTIMLQMLTNNFLGADVPYEKIRNRYLPALERIIDNIVRDTVVSRTRLGWKRPGSKEDNEIYDELTDLVLAARKEKKGLWAKFQSNASDEEIRGNVKVILAGALEATASWSGWAISHLARHPEAQNKIYEEVKNFREYTPENLDKAPFLGHVLDETLRLTPSLYFLPRRAPEDITVKTADGKTLFIPKGTHILLDIWDTNRHEDNWGQDGFPANEFHPERWDQMARGMDPSRLHFGFGAGARVCPGRHLGRLEVSLLVGALTKAFKISATGPSLPRAGVSTKPIDGTKVRLELRTPEPTAPAPRPSEPSQTAEASLPKPRVRLEMGPHDKLHFVVGEGKSLPARIAGGLLTLSAQPFWLNSMSKVMKAAAKNTEPISHYDKMLQAAGVSYRAGGEVDSIPKEGPLLLVANHQLFGMDAMAIAALVSKTRPDIKIVGNQMMKEMPGFKDIVIGVDMNGDARTNAKALREMRDWMAQGKTLLIFPEGKITTGEGDSEWSRSIAYLARATQAQVQPILAQGRAPSNTFQLIHRFLPAAVRSTYPGEILNLKGSTIDLTVGKPIEAKELERFETDAAAAQYLRDQTYGLRRAGQ